MSVPLFFIALILGVILFLLLLFLKFEQPNKMYIKPFVWLVFIATVYEFTAFELDWNVVIWSKIYTFFEFIILCYFYYQILNKRHKKFFYSSFFIFIILFLYFHSIWNFADGNQTESFLTTFETVFVIISTILWFIAIFEELRLSSLLDSSNYYYVSGFTLYFTGTFFLFLASDYLLKNYVSQFLSYWNLNIMFTLLLRTLLIVGMWKERKK